VDPITRASRTFLAQADAFWRAGQGPLLPMIADASARGDLVKTLRLAELALANRRPLFVHEEPFTGARTWADGLAVAIAEDYQAVREGAEKEGVALPPFPAATEGPSEKDPPLARAVWAMERASALLAERLDGVLVALLPKTVADPPGYRDAIATLAATRFSRRVRLAVHDPPGGALAGVLGGDGARYEVDQDALAEHLKQLGAGGGSEGPPGPPPPEPTDEQRRAYEAKTGSKLPAPGVTRMLRTLLVDAAMATSRRDHEDAATHYQAARKVCQREGLVLEEATVLVALGGACIAAGELRLADDAYRRAGELAEGIEAWLLVCQARLGAAGAHLTAKRYDAAALAYGDAGSAAERAGSAALGVEALRMAGTCHLLRGAQSEAMRAWLKAVDLGGEIALAERPASTFPRVAEDLAAMLERRGLHAQAVHVRQLLVTEPAPAPDPPPASADTLDVAVNLDVPPRALPFAPATGAFSPVAAAPRASTAPNPSDAEGRATLPLPDDTPGPSGEVLPFPSASSTAPAAPSGATSSPTFTLQSPAAGSSEDLVRTAMAFELPSGLRPKAADALPFQSGASSPLATAPTETSRPRVPAATAGETLPLPDDTPGPSGEVLPFPSASSTAPAAPSGATSSPTSTLQLPAAGSSEDLVRTAMAFEPSGLRPNAADALPFQSGASSPLATAPTETSRPRVPAATAGETLDVGVDLIAQMRSTLPFAGAGASAPPIVYPRMPLEAYASFCAELAAFTNDAAAVFAKYHVSGELARAALDHEWQTRFDAHADTKAKWQKLFDACRARLLQQQR